MAQYRLLLPEEIGVRPLNIRIRGFEKLEKAGTLRLKLPFRQAIRLSIVPITAVANRRAAYQAAPQALDSSSPPNG